MLSRTKVLGKLHQLDPNKDYKITPAVIDQTFEIEDTRQPIRGLVTKQSVEIPH